MMFPLIVQDRPARRNGLQICTEKFAERGIKRRSPASPVTESRSHDTCAEYLQGFKRWCILDDLAAFVSVVRSRGFRDSAKVSGASASSLSRAVQRLETRLGVELLVRTTRRVTLTAAGERLFERLAPALDEVESALDAVNSFRAKD